VLLENLSGLKEPKLLLDIFGVQGTVLLLDMSGLQKPVLLQDMSGLQELVPWCARTWLVHMLELHKDVPGLHGLVLLFTCLVCRPVGACTALGPGRSARADAVSGHGLSAWACSSQRRV